MLNTITRIARISKGFKVIKPVLAYCFSTTKSFNPSIEEILMKPKKHTLKFNTQTQTARYSRTMLLKYNFSTITPEQIQLKMQEFEDFDFQIGKVGEVDKRFKEGTQLIEQGDWKKGYQLLTQIIQNEPNNYGMLLYTGLIAQHQKDREVLINMFQRALEIDPKHSTSRKMRAKLARNYIYTKRQAQGRQLYKKLIEEDPKDWSMNFHQAISEQLADPVMYQLIETIEAAEKFHKAGEIEKMYEIFKIADEANYTLSEKTIRAMAVIYKHMINVCEQLNKPEEAKKYQEKLHKLQKLGNMHE